MHSFLIPLQQGTDTLLAFVGAFCLVFIMGLAYFMPTFIALARKHPNTLAILALNLLLGWTILEWIGSLVWSLTSTNR